MKGDYAPVWCCRFLTACYQHEESCRPFDWYGITIDGFTPNSSFHAWYTQGSGAPGTQVADVVWPGDATCAPQGVTHGAC